MKGVRALTIRVPDINYHLMRSGTRYTLRGKALQVAAMLLAMMSLVVHGAVPGMAGNTPIGLHEQGRSVLADCHKHEATDGADHASHGSMGDEHKPLASYQLNCCAAVTVVVLPTSASARLPRRLVLVGVAPQPAPILEGLHPESPSEPPRTTYQG